MEFREFKQAVQRKFTDMRKQPLFRIDIDKDELWALYLNSFPEGSNPRFRERTEHDCSCCRSFIKNAGSVVNIVPGGLVSIWDIEGMGEYQPSIDEMAAYIKNRLIENVFLHPEPAIGTDRNRELDGDTVLTWEHLHITLPSTAVAAKAIIGPKCAEFTAMHDVVLRSLREISIDAIDTVLDLISQNSLYRGAEKKNLLDAFRSMKSTFSVLGENYHDLYAWSQVQGPNAWVCKIRNDVIGTLLVDISEGVELESAVKSFEDKVSGTNYKRPTALVTPKMRDQAKQTLTDLGLMNALDRRYARLEDIKVTNVLFADRSAKKRMSGDVFDKIPLKGAKVQSFDKIEEVTIDKFLSDILPTATSLEVLFEGRQTGNLVSLIAPEDLTAKTMFKWSNPFSWSYNGDVADSDIRKKVAAMGGRVDGVFRFSHSWNYGKRNASLMDLHVFMPGSSIAPGNGVNDNYGNSERVGWNHRNHAKSGGIQDVDYVQPAPVGYIPVENITFPDIHRMPEGRYTCKVHNWDLRQPTQGGFRAEIEFGGELFEYEVDRPLGDKEWVTVACVTLKNGVFTITHELPTSTASTVKWNIKTQHFHPVTAVMLSPNFWEGSQGNKHFFFMLDGCKNDGSARGFYNEFLSSELEPHRKTMELVGSKMRTDECPDQMSGLGFSSTQRNNLVCKVTGSFTRTVRITF